MHRKKPQRLWLAGLMSVALGACINAQAATIYVKADAVGANDGTSWADALTDLSEALAWWSSPGDEIWVAAGVYTPTLAIGGSFPDPIDYRLLTFQLQPSVAVYGGFAGTETARDQRDWATNTTVLDGRSTSFNVVYSTDCDNATVLDGFTITGGDAADYYPNDRGGGMYNVSSSPIVADCIFRDNWPYFGGGMYNEGFSAPTLLNCVFTGNGAYYGDGGAMYNASSLPSVTNCTFSLNSASWTDGIYIDA